MKQKIFTALTQTHPDDLETVRKYIAWVRFRRRMHDTFYFAAHWIKPRRRIDGTVCSVAHWIRPGTRYHWV